MILNKMLTVNRLPQKVEIKTKWAKKAEPSILPNAPQTHTSMYSHMPLFIKS